MKKLFRTMTFSVAGAAMGLFMMAAPLVSTAQAAENPSALAAAYDREHHRDDGERRHHHGLRDDRFFAHRLEFYRNWQLNNPLAIENQNPVDVVMSVADFFGFDVNRDTFTLRGQDDSEALVQIVHKGVNYTVKLVPSSNNSWIVSLLNHGY